MIYGDPFLFSLQFDIVDVFELRTTIDFYSNMKIDELACNDIPFDPITLYRNAESYFTGEGEDLIDGLFDMTCTAMGDNGYYIYFMKTSQNDCLI